eukprot:s6995_g3.t1
MVRLSHFSAAKAFAASLHVGGRFDSQALALLRRLARARARDRAPWAREAAGAALTRRWTALAALAALRAHAPWAREAAGAALTRRWTALAALAALRAHAQSLLELPVRPCDASDGAELPLGELLAAPP